MKKIITPVAIALLGISPLLAEDYPIELMIRDMGYSSHYMTVDVVNSVKKSNADAKAYYATKKLEQPSKKKSSQVISYKGFEKDDILQPRISEASESPEMIPALLRYHKENPKADKITRKLAVTTYSIGQYKEALYWYTLTYQRNRSDLESLWNMASIADSIGEKQQAVLYLREYARVDPNSAWGRMARNLLSNGYSADNMSESFDDQMARVLNSSGGSENKKSSGNKVERSGNSNDDGMIVVSGDKYDLESFVASYKPNKNFNETSAKDGDTLKGTSQTKSKSKKSGSKTSLESATVNETPVATSKPIAGAKVVPAYKAAPPIEEDASVTTTAAPLGD